MRANLPLEINEKDNDEAIEQGAMAFFGEKYGDRVRVVRMGDFSVELCGGTHVSRTGDIGSFALTSEGSVSSGVRRVEALTARGAESWLDGRVQLLDDLARLLKVPAERVEERISRLLEENKVNNDSREKAAAYMYWTDSFVACPLPVRAFLISAGL